MAVGRKANQVYTLVLWLTKTGSYLKSIVSHTHIHTAIHSHLLFLSAGENHIFRLKAIQFRLGCSLSSNCFCPIPESFGSREPTCAELLKTSELSEEQRLSEFTSLCHFYMLSCPITLDLSGCQRLAQDNCQSRFKKCRALIYIYLNNLNNPVYYFITINMHCEV